MMSGMNKHTAVTVECPATITVHVPMRTDLAYVADALSEGEHTLGDDATRAGYALAHLFPGNDCPWGRNAMLDGYGPLNADGSPGFVDWSAIERAIEALS